MKKLLIAGAILTAASSASASEVEWSFPFGDSAQPVQEFIFAYNSQSIVTDSDGNGVISNGDQIMSVGGFGTAGFDSIATPLTGQGFDSFNQNNIGSFNPNIPFPSGYASNYIFTFSFNNLMGEWNNGDFAYTSGTIDFGVYTFGAFGGFAANTFNSLFTVDVAKGGPENVGGQQKQIFRGDVTATANGAGANFSITEGLDTQSLADWLAEGKVYFRSNQTVDAGIGGVAPPSADLTFDTAGGTALVAANHTGRFALSVPEPSTLAIFGLSLLGFAAAGRRRKA
ncbi:PEP-CTERM sorting domain-containing protein [Alteromonas oceanisediminis]|uniref:PEP-CTERM sorting domain-containing protein n=1 Tax=Alteromonas oceanisediminis TaxID=2836180 RepID=UPI001BDB6240|nr:PEP-CTERM sorting domain-containing protein [Alteromonas oceanisediminis]MBT0585687.1 PEP-CTERM sorting domain-containing protein [Alteromonas oceanisediminis]